MKVMKNRAQIGLIILVMIFLNINMFAETKKWITEKTKDGKVTVRNKISSRTDEKGNEVQLIEYVATTTANVSMSKCISVIKDVSNHKLFLDDEVSMKIKTLSNNECVVYYYNDAPWPLPNFDCVAKMIFSEDKNKKTATFKLTAAPSMYKKKKVRRMTYYNIIYAFNDLGNGKVEITITAKMTPAVQAPDWMVRGYFPNGIADTLRKIIKIAKSNY